MVVPFDPQRLELTGAAVPVVEGVLQSTSSGAAQYSFSATRDRLVYVPGGLQVTQRRLVWVNRNGAEQPVAPPAHNFRQPRLSPDGRWLAYDSDESGRLEVYVQPYPGPGGKWLISTEGGTQPVWNPNGRQLFYRNGDKMMAVEITMQPGFAAGKPRVLFEGQYGPSVATFPNYDVTPDGQRFLMLKAAEAEQAPTQINVVLNWFEELRRRAPPRKK